MTIAAQKSSLHPASSGADRETSNPSCPSTADNFTSPSYGTALIRDLLDQQQSLTAVEQFGRWHADVVVNGVSPTAKAHYHKLLPATPPAPGQQYAFEVDLDRC